MPPFLCVTMDYVDYEARFKLARESLSLVRYFVRHFPDYPLTEAMNGKWYGSCPLHQEEEGQSFSLNEQVGRWRCWGKCQAKGDISELEFWRMGGKATLGNTRYKAVDRLLAERELYAHEKGKKRNTHYTKVEKSPFVWNWRKALQPFPEGNVYVRFLAQQRELRAGAVRRAIKEGLLWYIDSREGPAWVVTDVLQKQAVWRRLDGKHWHGTRTKAKLLPGCSGKTPIGVEEARTHDPICVVEGGPDMLAALDLHLPLENIGVVVMPNAHSNFDRESVRKFAGKRIWIYAHQDEVGQKAGQRWQKQLGGKIMLLDGKKDLNEWLVSRRNQKS